MAAPPPEGFSPWPQDLPAVAADPLPGQAPLEATAAQRAIRRPAPPPELTPWLWLPVALSSMLVVLFVVVVNRQQAQAQRIGELLSRVQDLEHSRALERTAVLEQQLRSMLDRLQQLEKQNKQQEQLSRQLQTLQEEVRQLRSAASGPISPLEPDLPQDARAGRSPRPMSAMPVTP